VQVVRAPWAFADPNGSPDWYAVTCSYGQVTRYKKAAEIGPNGYA
jgi:hypothetical protein